MKVELGGHRVRPGPALSLTPPTLVALSMASRPLRDLRDWPPVGALIETVRAAVGGAGISKAEVQRLHRWSRRWSALRSEVRAFYVDHCDDPAATHVLRRLLDGTTPSGPAMGRVSELYREAHGHDPPWPLCPGRLDRS